MIYSEKIDNGSKFEIYVHAPILWRDSSVGDNLLSEEVQFVNAQHLNIRFFFFF